MRWGRTVTYASSIALFVMAWALVSLTTLPIFVPSPWLTARAAVELVSTQVLPEAVAVSFLRIFSGWLLGGVIGVPIGLFMGRVPVVRQFATPYIEFFRFVPPIAFVTLFLIWFGTGEQSKVLLIFYTSIFVVVLNTMSGVLSVRPGSIRAARCLGASERQILWYVVVPETVPFIVTGMRLAMGNSFMTIVAAEMLAAKSGIGFIIWTSRGFMLTDQIFVAVIALGLMGFATDWVFRATTRRGLSRYKVV
ncbi:MAG: ABC transporter permease [Candidatus Rokubacteria bacterium]|nr:ABC transporter permease [Candidatus Rokubacteria bacterium]